MSQVLPFPVHRFSPPATEAGHSEEAEDIRRTLGEVTAGFNRTHTLGSAFEKLIRPLDEAFLEASTEDWDGHGARQSDPRSYKYARLLIETLPIHRPIPKVGVDPDGEIDFEWYVKPSWAFSVSVSSRGELAYAGLFGRNEVHGIEQFEGGDLPSAILENLRRLYSEEVEAHAAERSAR